MAYRYIWVKKQKYYYYDTYSDWKTALARAKYFRRKNKCRYKIWFCHHPGFMGQFPFVKYELYLNKIMKLWQ